MRVPKKFRVLLGGVLLIFLSLLVYFVKPTDPFIYTFIFVAGLSVFFLAWIALPARFAFYLSGSASYTLYLAWKGILYIELFLYIFLIMLLTEGYVLVSRRVLQ